MSIVVEVVQSFDETIKEGNHEMKSDKLITKTTIWRIRLYAKNNLFTGEWRKHIGNNVFEIIALLNLPGKQQFPSDLSHQFKLNDKYKKMLPESEIIEKEEKFRFAQKFEDANLELDDLQYLTKNDFEVFVKDVVPRIKLMKYVESNYDCKVK
eukprot:gene6783-10947_t